MMLMEARQLNQGVDPKFEHFWYRNETCNSNEACKSKNKRSGYDIVNGSQDYSIKHQTSIPTTFKKTSSPHLTHLPFKLL